MNRQLTARKPRKSIVPVLIAAAVLLAGAIFAANMREDKPESSAATDLAFIWQMSAQLAPQGADDRRWLIRYDAGGMRNGDVLRAAGLLGLHRSEAAAAVEADAEADTDATDDPDVAALAGDAEEAVKSGEKKHVREKEQAIVYDGELVIQRSANAVAPYAGREEDAGQAGSTLPEDMEPPNGASLEQRSSVAVPVTLYMNNNGERSAIVIVQPPAGMTSDELTTVADRVEAALQQAGGHYDYSFRVSGSAAKTDTGDAPDMNQLMEGVIAEAEAKPVERYEDVAGAAISQTYMSPHIGASIETNGERANLQLSVHRNSETGAADWVIGVPVITGDYTPAG